jgi:methylglutaconyl-CoA hydratase
MEAFVSSTIENRLATILFFHPAQNSLPGTILAQLAQRVQECGINPAVDLVLIRSEGDKSFCAGASFDELAAIQDFKTGQQFFSGFANVILAIRNCPVPVLGRIHGKAIGGGVGLAAAMDYALASQYASIRLSELAVGIGPFVIGPVVERKMGLAAFQKMALSPSEWQTAQWAKDKGLYTEVFESVEQLDNYLEQFIKTLLNYNPEALRQLKKIFWEDCPSWNQKLLDRAAISGQLVLSDFSKKAIAAFKNKS